MALHTATTCLTHTLNPILIIIHWLTDLSLWTITLDHTELALEENSGSKRRLTHFSEVDLVWCLNKVSVVGMAYPSLKIAIMASTSVVSEVIVVDGWCKRNRIICVTIEFGLEIRQFWCKPSFAPRINHNLWININIK